MALPNIFSEEVTDKVIQRIYKLTPSSTAHWGTMTVAQMLAHCSVTYEMVFDTKHTKPNFLVRLLLKSFVKNSVVNEVPYKKDSRTAPAFIVTSQKDFEIERSRLIDFIRKTQNLGASYFDGKASNSFGALKAVEWNNMFYKHLDHHLTQFGV